MTLQLSHRQVIPGWWNSLQIKRHLHLGHLSESLEPSGVVPDFPAVPFGIGFALGSAGVELDGVELDAPALAPFGAALALRMGVWRLAW